MHSSQVNSAEISVKSLLTVIVLLFYRAPSCAKPMAVAVESACKRIASTTTPCMRWANHGTMTPTAHCWSAVAWRMERLRLTPINAPVDPLTPSVPHGALRGTAAVRSVDHWPRLVWRNWMTLRLRKTYGPQNGIASIHVCATVK